MERSAIDLSGDLIDQIGNLYLTSDYSDIILCVGTQRISAHRCILAQRSEYFRALLYGGLSESSKTEITLKDVPVEAFKEVLRYIYTGRLPLAQMDIDTIVDVVNLCQMYGFSELVSLIVDHLGQTLTMDTVSELMETARLLNCITLTDACLKLVERHAADFLQHNSFRTLSQVRLFYKPVEKCSITVLFRVGNPVQFIRA